MSFSTMNGINQTKTSVGGMQGTVPNTPVRPMVNGSSQQYAVTPPQYDPNAAARFAATHTAPAPGMMGTQGHILGGNQTANAQAHAMWNAATDGSGVDPGDQGPAVPQGPQGPAFDPNDPDNAALAGYMAR